MCSHFSVLYRNQSLIRFIFIISFCFFSAADVFGTTYYEIWRNTTNNSSTATRIKEWYTSTNYDDSDVSQGQHYYYWVKVITANTAYGYHPNMITEVTGKLWVICPTLAVQGQSSRILYKARLEPFGSHMEGNLTNYLKEDDSFSDDTMSQWSYSGISLWGTTAWEYEWTKDIIISNYEPLNSTAEVYGTFDFLHGNQPPYTYHVTPQTPVINCAVVSSYSSPPSGVSASPGTYPDKIRIQWNSASGVSSFSSSAEGWKSIQYALTVQSSVASNVSISSSTGHSGTTTYMKTVNGGTSVNLCAPQYSGSCSLRLRFNGWAGSVNSSNLCITFTMDGNKTVTANYVSDPETYTLSVNSSGVSNVSISSSTGNGGTTNYTKTITCGTNVTLTAPSSSGGKSFTGWTGDVSSSNQTISFTMNGTKTVTANYTSTDYTLSVNSSGTSNVIINSNTGHQGTTNYTKTVTNGTTVNLQAPMYVGSCASRSRFNGWTGSVTNSNQSISFTMDGNKTVVANYIFEPETYTLTVNSSGASNVNIGSSTGHQGTTNYTKIANCGTNVTLTAPSTASGKSFGGWTGDISSSNQMISFSMNGAMTVTANYSSISYNLSTSVIGGHGTLTPSSGTYGEETVVILTAVPDDGYIVKAWSGTDNDLSKANTNTVTMNSNKSVTVKFEIGQQTPSGWNIDLYDLHNSNLYPYPSGTRTSNTPFIEKWNVPGNNMKTGDVDGDGVLELVVSDASNLYVYDSVGQVKWQIITTASLNALADVTSDGKPEILTNIKNGATARINAYDISEPNFLVKTFITSVDPDYGIVIARCATDLDQNGSMELVGYKAAPWVQCRGTIAFSCDTMNELWYYDIGPAVYTPAIGDVAGLFTDKEVLHGGYGVANGVTGADGSTDGECYAFLLGANGNSLWRKQFEGSGFVDSSIGLCDIDNNGRLDIIATSFSHGWDLWGGSLGRVYVLDPVSGEPISGLEHNFVMPVTLGGFADLDEDGIPEILVNKKDGTTQTGSIIALNPISGLPVKYEFSVADSGLDVLFINDLNGDGKLEVAIKGTPTEGTDNALYVLDNELNLLWSMNISEGFGQAIVSDLDQNGKNEIIVSSGGYIRIFEGNECYDTEGDFDNDCDVDMIDFGILANEWLLSNDPGYPMSDPELMLEADLNGDLNVNFLDFVIFAENWLVGYVPALPELEMFYSQLLDSNPSWTTEGQWQYGLPLSQGGESYGYSDPSSGYTGNNVYGVNLTGDYSIDVDGPFFLTTSAINCTGYSNVHLKFARWLNTDYPPYVRGAIEVSNNGTTWQTVWEITGEIIENVWHKKEYDISAVADNQPTVYIRWSYEVGILGAYAYSGWNIDDVELWGIADNDENDIVWIYIDDPGVSGQEGFTGYMSKYETTNAQYCQFLNDAKGANQITVYNNLVYAIDDISYSEPYYDLAGTGIHWNGAINGGAARIHFIDESFTVDNGFGNHPVTYVSWYGATAFCNYYGWRLPTHEEWKAVADYDGSFIYGCGAAINNSMANYRDSSHPDGTTIIGEFGTYGYGICDMAGNVEEWTSSIYSDNVRIIHGGLWSGSVGNCKISSTSTGSESYMGYSEGFRACH
ncbi:MAG: hypothetical protein A2Y10_16525 [Planctomycetes bacterium GWF2_41_51]|nr:MAG: hypothetical protein A2Y10_16525 [Planctomycetes bacterium GWF2_41_51]HBG27926.1 hypothetical protein [Phycisphaerales bacterium]